jgi:hypothetical protein
MTIKPFFRWYDLWIGCYIDRENRTAYICPLPMLGVSISLGCHHRWSGWVENLGRFATGNRYRICQKCSAIEHGA